MSKTNVANQSRWSKFKAMVVKDSRNGAFLMLAPFAAFAAAVPFLTFNDDIQKSHEKDESNTTISTDETTTTSAPKTDRQIRIEQAIDNFEKFGYVESPKHLAPGTVEALGDAGAYVYKATIPGGHIESTEDSAFIGQVIEFKAPPAGNAVAPCFNVPSSLLEGKDVAANGDAEALVRYDANGASSICVVTGALEDENTLVAISTFGGFGRR